MGENEYKSFYDYLTQNGYLFDKEAIENYLLSLKVKPFAILTGNSGTGKTKLSQLFAQYLMKTSSFDYQDRIDSISTEVTVGKSFEWGGWTLNKNDLKKLIPVDKFESSYCILVDGFPAKGNLKVNPRLFYKGNELKQHLEDLAKEDSKQKVPLKIFLDEKKIIKEEVSSNFLEDEEKIKNYDIEEYISFKDKHSYKGPDFFALGLKTVFVLLGTYKHYYKMDICFDGYKVNKNINFQPFARSHDKKLLKHLKSIDNLADIEIKIRKKDIVDTFIKEQNIEKTKISFERKVGKWYSWVFNNSEWENILNIKRQYTWNAIVDGIETTFDFGIRRVDFYVNPDDDEGLKKLLDKKSQEDYIKIEADLSTLKRYDNNYNFDLEEEFGFILLKDNGDMLDEEIDIDEGIYENKSNYKIIPVGANWTENRHIVGYYNVITNEYQSTPAYDLIKEANNSTEPYFLILDEMNLSHVERYFADFLSAIESGEKIPLYGEEELTLPENLFIIGTVNVDETTYMFSPKVLDRANVIEFETYSASDYMNDNINLSSPSGNIEYLDLEEVENNYKIIPVGANWTENRHIVGYYNVITNEYQDTPAYKLIEKANSCEEPYFLILDEMNLSHVERYFADFLSAIESGEKIPLYGEEELTLPENLFIIGTVNVDETTYMFSPKVLDRANVIEFETYSASDYMNDNINLSSPSGNIEYLENPLAGNEIRSYGIDELREIFSDVVIDDEPFWDVLSYEINSFQTILSKSGFDFGFRVINEIVRFMAVAWEYEGKPSEFDNWTRYFDACIKQKMLPKLHGSEKIIGETLEELSNSCSDSVISTEDMVKYPESFKKLEEMKKILRKQRYVSFIN